MLDAGIDVISTVNVQHLESLNDAIFELTDVRVRETFPDRVLDEADEVVLVDLTPEALQERLRAGKVYPQERAERRARRTSSASRTSARCASSRCARSPRTSRPAAQRGRARPAQPAGGRRARARAGRRRSRSRSGSCAARGARRSGSAPSIDALWVRKPGAAADAEERGRSSPRCAGSRSSSASTSSRRRATTSSPTVRRVAARARLDLRLRRHAGRAPAPRDPARLARLRAWCASCPGIDIRVVANRADRERADAVTALDRRSSPSLVVVLAAALVAAAGGRRGGSRGPAARRHARPVHRRQLDPTVLARGDPHRPRRGRRARARLPARRPARSTREDSPLTRGGRGRDAAARGGRARGAHGGRPRRRADREGAPLHARAAAAVGRRALRPHRRAGAERPRAAASRRRTSPGSSTHAPTETLVLEARPDGAQRP